MGEGSIKLEVNLVSIIMPTVHHFDAYDPGNRRLESK